MKKAFSLLEVMIAVVIFGLALIPLMNMLDMGRRMYAKTENTVRAYNLAVEGLEWMKSLDFLGYYFPVHEKNGDGFNITAHYSYTLDPAKYTKDYKSDFSSKDPQIIMYVYNVDKISGDPDTDPLDKGALPLTFYGYFPMKNGKNMEMTEVKLAYNKRDYAFENMSQYKRWGYYKMLTNNSAEITCVVTWAEGRFTTGNNENRIEKLSTVVFNNANVEK